MCDYPLAGSSLSDYRQETSPLYLGLVLLEDQLHTQPGLGSHDMQTPFQLADSLSQDSLYIYIYMSVCMCMICVYGHR